MYTQNKPAKTKRYSHNHEGHRQRLKVDYAHDCNLDRFHPHQVLELLLFYIIPQKDTNEIAHELINRFGSLEAVLNADRSELEKIDGIKGEASLYLTLFNSLERCRRMNSPDLPEVLDKPEKLIAYLKPQYYNKDKEVSMIVCLDSRCRVIGCYDIIEGASNFTAFDPRKVMDIVIRSNAAKVVLSHNHPSGDSTPSRNDVETTGAIIRMLTQVGVKVCDHIIISPEGDTAMSTIPKFMMMFK